MLSSTYTSNEKKLCEKAPFQFEQIGAKKKRFSICAPNNYFANECFYRRLMILYDICKAVSSARIRGIRRAKCYVIQLNSH